MLSSKSISLNNFSWELFGPSVDSIQVISSDEMSSRYMQELRKTRAFRLFSVRTKHSYYTGELVAFAVAYGSKVDNIQRSIFISDSASKNDVFALKASCSSEFGISEVRVAA